ncbi:ferredoxin reductase [Aquabacterium soli]|uniref:Ferredoxin reductase n=1 Tax=Aquabacterium soli TaxID=2493092 RepID=A0A426V7C6_9BURK|nr:ferredoxin reductase [Aquabacterium soli]RRS02859.1 ferredoxin reductase [Aquabacterium soli]
MSETSSPTAAVSATQRVASWLTHMGVSTYAFDDTLGLVNPLWTVNRLHARVVTKTPETASATTVVLQAGSAFKGLKPGQFVIIGVEINGVRHRRAYSPRAIDGRRDRFAITVQRQAGGKVSNFVHDQLQPGDIIEIEQAGGDFTLPAQTPAEVLLVAGGSGITPCMSILEQLRRHQSATRVTLIYFARSRADRIFARTLETLATQWPALRYVPLESVVNTPGAAPSAAAAATLSTELLSELQPQWAALPAYCCGPAPLMDAARQIWKDAGASERLRLEAFAAARPSGDPNVRHQIRIVRGDQPMAFEAPATETLLVAGEQAGHAIKHGCRQGICHECTCRLNSGAVRDLTTGEQIHGEGQPVRLCVSAALSDLSLESLN